MRSCNTARTSGASTSFSTRKGNGALVPAPCQSLIGRPLARKTSSARVTRCVSPAWMRAVGYRQAWSHLRGEVDAVGFREQAIAATRQLAKRQFTWLRREHDARWLDPMRQRGELAAALALFAARGEAGGRVE